MRRPGRSYLENISQPRRGRLAGTGTSVAPGLAMTYDKRKRAQPSRKRRQEKEMERAPQRQPHEPTEPAKPDQPGPRRRPGEGLDKSDEGVIAGSRLAGRRFTG
jgi:hypothetical protein